MNRPALKISLYVALGILLGRFVTIPIYILLVTDALVYVSTLTAFIFKRSPGKWRPVLYILLVISASTLHYELHTSHFSSNHISNFLHDPKPITIEGRIASLPELQEERSNFFLKVTSIGVAAGWRETEGKVRMTIGERADRFSFGDVIRFRGRLEKPPGLRNPGGFDYGAYLNRQGVYGVVFVRKADAVEIVERAGGNPFLSRLIWPLKKSMRRTIERNLTGPQAALLKGVLLGERSDVPRSIEGIFRDSGVIHVLAVSGLHVGLVVFIFFNLFRALRLPFNGAVLFTLSVILLYVFVTGFRSPVVRASLMAGIILVGLTLERNVDFLNTIAFAGLVILVITPGSLFDPGFQLSFAAVLSIVYVYPRLKEWLPMSLRRQHTWWRRWLLGGSLVSLSAQLGIVPIVAYSFYRIPLISLPANVIVVPWVGLILSLGFAASIFGAFSSQIGLLLNASNWLALTGLIKAVAFFASLPWSTLSVPQPSVPFILGYYCVLGLLVNVKRVYGARRWLVLALLVAVNYCLWTSALSDKRDSLTVTFLDVGHGDAAFIHFPGGKTMLVDGGRKSRYYDCGERVIDPFLRKSGIRKIDAVLVTHPHSDHLGGILTVLRDFQIGQLLDSGVKHSSTLYEVYVGLIEQRGISKRILRAGDMIDGFSPVRIRVLHPSDAFATPEGLAPHGLNNASVVLRLDYGKVSFLLLGDVEMEADRALLERSPFLKATVVKIPHQGSNTGSAQKLVEAIEPAVAVVSVAERNRFGHPAREVMRRYRDCEARIYRTDRHGAIIIRTKGEGVSIETMTGSE